MQELADLETGEKAFLLQRISRSGAARLKELEQSTGLGKERIHNHLTALVTDGAIVELSDQWADAGSVRSWQRQLCSRIEQYHLDFPLQTGIPLAALRGTLPEALSPKGFEALLGRLLASHVLVRHDDFLALTGFAPRPDSAQQSRIDAIEALWQEAGAEAKNNTEMLSRLTQTEVEAAEAIAFLINSKRLVRLNAECTLHAEAYAVALALLSGPFADQEFTLAEFRDALNSSRKMVQALLEHFDALKYTLRKGEVRVTWKLPLQAGDTVRYQENQKRD
jgi:selenocysteine-specific elongation factor